MATVINGNTGIDKVQDGSIHEADINADVARLGVGQTWQVVTRTSGTQYTNATGKPIVLRILNSSPVNVGSSTSILLNGVPITLASSNNPSTAAGSTTDEIIIPVDATYTLTDTNVTSRTTWELR